MLSLFEKRKPLLSRRKTRSIIKEFGKNAKCRVVLLHGKIWPINDNSPQTLKRVLDKIVKKVRPNDRTYRYFKDFLDDDDNQTCIAYSLTQGLNYPLCGKKIFNFVALRPYTEDEWRETHFLDTMHDDIDLEDFATFILYHELFHAYDAHAIKDDEADAHRGELFADFAACLMMASRGKEYMFLEIAKWRALNIKETDLIYADKEVFLEEDVNSYQNFHLYGIYKRWRRENPHIDIENLQQHEIVNIALQLVEEYAFDEQKLMDLSVTRFYDAQSSIKTIDHYAAHWSKIDTIRNRRIYGWAYSA